MFGRGDSGGPVFQYANNNTQAVPYGMISSIYDSGIVPCPYWESDNTCSNDGLMSLAINLVRDNNVTFVF